MSENQVPFVVKELREKANLFIERNAVYGDTYKRHGTVMSALFPDGASLETINEHSRWQILNTIVSKLVRYSANMHRGGHDDSLDDISVYAMMLKELDGNEKENAAHEFSSEVPDAPTRRGSTHEEYNDACEDERKTLEATRVELENQIHALSIAREAADAMRGEHERVRDAFIRDSDNLSRERADHAAAVESAREEGEKQGFSKSYNEGYDSGYENGYFSAVAESSLRSGFLRTKQNKED